MNTPAKYSGPDDIGFKLLLPIFKQLATTYEMQQPFCDVDTVQCVPISSMILQAFLRRWI